MDYSNLIREVVKTYELPSRLESRIIAVAERRVRELYLNRDIDVYRYVDHLVGKFTPRREDKLTVSLDAVVKHDSDTAFHEFIGQQDPNLLAIQSPKTGEKYGTRIQDVVDVLKGRLSEVDFGILAQLAYQGYNIFGSDPENLAATKDEIVAQLPQIQERIEAVAKAYERDGRIVIPPRPIVYVQFNPVFYIKFGVRRFNGKPLAFFEAHRDVYGDMSRGELWRFDKSLYNSLVEQRQIARAIPELKPLGLPQSEVDKIVAAHKTYKGNARRTERELGYNDATIIKYWNERGLSAKGVANKLSEEEERKVIEAWKTYNGNATRAAKDIGYDVGTIKKHWQSHGLKAVGHGGGNTGLPKEDIERIISAHKIYQGNLAQASTNLGYSTMTIRKYWKQTGLQSEGRKISVNKEKKLGPTKRRLSQTTIDQIVNAYDISGGNAAEAGRQLHYSAGTILRYWKRAGLEAKGIAMTKDEIQKTIEAYRTYNGNAAAAARTLGYSQATIINRWNAAGLEAKGKGSPEKLPKKEIDKIVVAHHKYNGNMSEAARHLPYSAPTIRRYWAENGLEANLNEGNKQPKVNVRRIIAVHKKYDGNAMVASRKLGYNASTVRRHWRDAGLQSQGKAKSRKLSERQIKSVLAAHRKYKGNAAEASRHLPWSDQTIMDYWKRAGLSAKGAESARLPLRDIKIILSSYWRFQGNSSAAANHLPWSYPTIKKYWRQAGLAGGLEARV